jgi:hypothetical protein
MDRLTRSLTATTLAAALLLVAAPGALALSKGVLTGSVSGSHGPVAGAHVIATGEHNNLAEVHTDASGHYTVEAWPDTYRVSAYPPPESSEGFASMAGVAVAEGATTAANLLLPAERGNGHVSGNAFYADHSPDAGVEVSVYEDRYESGRVNGVRVQTDENGNWDAGSLPAGLYTLSYFVLGGGPNLSSPESHFIGSEAIVIEPGSNQFLSKELSGPKPLASLLVNVTAAEGWPAARGSIHIERAGGGASGDADFRNGSYRFPALPEGTYLLRASGGRDEDDGTETGQATVSDGHLSSVSIVLPANPVPSGTAAAREQEELSWLNAQRAQWGIPAGLTTVPLWSQACAAHDAYGAANHVLEHPEDPGKPGHSVGGQWAGEHSILAGGGGWSQGSNPWNDAPIHLNQLMTPSLSAVGIDDNHQGYQCVTTWPGMLRSEPAGTIHTYPGDGTVGIPPAEMASESPTTPNKELGIPDLAGRQLFVYEAGTENFNQGLGQINVLSASLTGPSGPVPVKVADDESSIGGFLTGAIIVPVQPLAAYTTYRATVTLAPVTSFADVVTLPGVTHSWSFTTGRPNPNGNWDEGGESSRTRSKRRSPRRSVRASYRHGHVIVVGRRFDPGPVTIRRKVLLRRERKQDGRLLARAHANAKGVFRARIAWPRKHLAFRVYQGGRTTFGIFDPGPSRPHHRHGAIRHPGG